MKRMPAVLAITLALVLAYKEGNAQQWAGPNDQTSLINRSGNITVNSLYLGRYNGPLSGDSNPFNLYHADGQRDLVLFGSNASTFHLRLFDDDLKMGDQQNAYSTFYNNGSIYLGGTIGDRLTVGGEGKMNTRLGRWASLGETGSALATVLGSNVRASLTTNGTMEIHYKHGGWSPSY